MIWGRKIAVQYYSATRVKKTITIARTKADLVASGSRRKVEMRALLVNPNRRVIAGYRVITNKGRVRKSGRKNNMMYALYKLRR